MAEKDLLERVKRRFMRMTSPHEFSSQEKRRAATIVSANVPPLLARADAAADTAAEIIRRDLVVNVQDTDRHTLYSYAKNLAEEAGRYAGEAMQNAAADKRKLELVEFMEYTDFLCLHLNLLISLTAAQMQADSPGKNSILPEVIRKQDLLCNTGELAVLPFLQESVTLLAPRLEKIREQCRKIFSKTDSDRYARSYESFLRAYKEEAEKLT